MLKAFPWFEARQWLKLSLSCQRELQKDGCNEDKRKEFEHHSRSNASSYTHTYVLLKLFHLFIDFDIKSINVEKMEQK